jgi:cell division protein FtsB
VAATAQARQAATAPRRRPETERLPARPAARRAPQARQRAAQRARLMRLFVVFVVCLTVLAVGRVALSFAVVQKSLQTDAVAREVGRLSAENQRLQETVANQGSSVNIRKIALKQLGLVDATHRVMLKVHGSTTTTTQVAERD